MKKSIIILIILFAHLNVFSQEYVWTVYNIKVDRVNAGQVGTIKNIIWFKRKKPVATLQKCVMWPCKKKTNYGTCCNKKTCL